MTARSHLVAALGGLALAAGLVAGAQAAVISATFNQSLSAAPVTVSFNGVGGFQFTAATTGYGPGAGVATTGMGMVTTISGALTDFEAGASIDQTAELYSFSAAPNAAPIPFSAADDFIGLSLTLSDGVHYGYAELLGPSLVGVGFESSPGTSIQTGATGSGTGITLTTTTTTPEPASLVLLASGLAMLSVRRRSTNSAT